MFVLEAKDLSRSEIGFGWARLFARIRAILLIKKDLLG
jgi:hypothetical protein